MAAAKSDDAECYQSADDVVVPDGTGLPSDSVNTTSFLSRLGAVLSTNTASNAARSTAAVIPTSVSSPISLTSAGSAAVLSTGATTPSSSLTLTGNAAVSSTGATPTSSSITVAGNAAALSPGITPSTSYANALSTAIAGGSTARTKPKIRHFQANSAHLKSWMSRAISFKASHQNTTLNDYLKAISTSVPADQITDSARVSGTIQVFFKNSSWSQQLIATGLDFRGEHIDVLPIIVAPKRIIVSNVPPYFQESDLRTLMSDFGQVQGRIEKLPASVDPAVFGSVNSFRRAVSIQFASETEFENLPPSIDCFLGPKKFTFYLNNPFKCHLCKEIGHQQHSCPNLPSPQNQSTSNHTGAQVEIATTPNNEPASDSQTALPEGEKPSILPAHDKPLISANDILPTVEQMDAKSDFDSSSGFPKPKKKKSRKRQSQPSIIGASGGPPSKIAPVRASPISADQYAFVSATNTWKDADGCFTPIVDHSAIVSFTDAALAGTALDKRRLIEDIVKNGDDACALSRQVTVFAYTDPTIASITDSRARHRLRTRYTYIAKEIRRLYSFSQETDMESDAKTDSQQH